MDFFEMCSYFEEQKLAKRKWYIKLWEDYIYPIIFFGIPTGILVGIGILVGKYLIK